MVLQLWLVTVYMIKIAVGFKLLSNNYIDAKECCAFNDIDAIYLNVLGVSVNSKQLLVYHQHSKYFSKFLF